MKQFEFIHQLTFEHLPTEVVHSARTCLLDLLAVAAVGATTKSAQIISDFAQQQMQGKSPILFRTECASQIGAALANATLIDSFDAHDGHVLCKGHVGVAILPALCALYGLPQQQHKKQQREYLTALVVGYELGTRLGMALHRSASDYHTSGAWNAIAAAAVCARALKLNRQQTRHAVGIAEYHGPRSPMMRVIDHPTMLKDGSGVGAMTGVSSALLAQKGFTGAPAVTLEDQEFSDLYADLGENWLIQQQYFKRFAVCRWAQPAIEAAVNFRQQYEFDKLKQAGIKTIRVISFHQAVRLGAAHPTNSEEIQYGLAYAFICALLYADVPSEKVINGYADQEINHWIDYVVLEEDGKYNACFPQQRWAHFEIVLADGQVIQSEPARTKGDYDNPYEPEVLKQKALQLLSSQLPVVEAEKMIDLITHYGN